ncbi:hypothetical protein Thimo_1961 [Thioflavicoccus mobilis 8321]|uniref:Nucleoprotein/polynucleotide-associated enzyme n=1 Tax=Thioflavicoccus mobilis 8321 TaxID=765912 RepID=L0GXK6_9GAMM|nr:hypothetical protein Thimo_1961 [Thioflavicoccus mobilis 8321]
MTGRHRGDLLKVGNSLQEQLLKAGLVDEQKLKQARSDKRKKGKAAPKGAAHVDPAREQARRAQAEKAKRDRELNRQHQEATRRKALDNELRELIHAHRLSRDGGEVAFNFTDGSTLKRLYLRREQQQQVVDGNLAVVRQDTFYELIPAAIAERVAARQPERIIVFNKPGTESGEDDDYAEFKVPDDLMW